MNTQVDVQTEILADWMERLIASLSDQLRSVLKDSASTGEIGHTIWDCTPILCGYIWYSPRQNPHEENINAFVHLDESRRTVKVNADICWSNGEVIRDFGEHAVQYSSLTDLADKMDDLQPRIAAKMYEKMSELITSARPPKFRH